MEAIPLAFGAAVVQPSAMPGTIGRGPSLLARFRARRRHAAILILLGALLLSQSLLFAHRIDHGGSGHTVACLLCVVADQPAVASAYALPVFAAAKPVPVAARVPAAAPSAVILAYRSRAPPEHVVT